MDGDRAVFLFRILCGGLREGEMPDRELLLKMGGCCAWSYVSHVWILLVVSQSKSKVAYSVRHCLEVSRSKSQK